MTWKLIHDSETVGEWSEDLINKTVKKLINNEESSQANPKTFKRKVSP